MQNKQSSTQNSTRSHLSSDASKSAFSLSDSLESPLVNKLAHKLVNNHSKAHSESKFLKGHDPLEKAAAHSKAKHHRHHKHHKRQVNRFLLTRAAGNTTQFSNFADTSSLKLNGSSTQAGNVLRLTPAQQNQAGSAFIKTPYSIDGSTSFNTRFQFRLSGGNGNNGADGMTFMLQNAAAGNTALGTLGGGEGYSTIGKSLAIEFDSFKSGWDSASNQVSLLRNGDVKAPLAKANTPMDLNGSGAINAWIDYNGATDQLSVFLANGTTKPATALLKTSIDLAATVGTQAFVGFSAGTGGLTNIQDVENWQFTSSSSPILPPPPPPAANVIQATNASETLVGTTSNDTVSYANASNGITADLNAGISNRIARIMPLGDSITLGVTDNSSQGATIIGSDGQPYRPYLGKGGYRAVLWNKFQQNNLSIDFVGSQTGGSLVGDQNHEGHGGKTIDWLSDRINGYLSATNPDIVLLMAGTNDTFRQNGILDTAQQMAEQLSGLIDKIVAYSSKIKIQVATIAPIPTSTIGPPPGEVDNAKQTKQGQDFNNLLPGLVASKKLVGKDVTFVDTRSQTLGSTIGLTNSDIVQPETSRVHPNDGGYNKIGNLWFNSLNSTIPIEQGTYSVDQDSLVNIKNLIGSTFNDTIISGNGSNVLTGNSGADTFFYRTAGDGNDTITDFGTDDRFQISASGFGSGLAAGVALSGTAASTGVLVNGSSAISSDATFLYSSGSLWFDADGNGAGSKVKIADLSTQPASLSASQFKIVA